MINFYYIKIMNLKFITQNDDSEISIALSATCGVHIYEYVDIYTLYGTHMSI